MINITLSKITLAAFFAAAPFEVVPLLDTNSRLDLIDLYEAGQPAKVINKYGGTTELTHLSDTLLVLKMTEVSQVEFRHANDSTIEMVQKFLLPEGEIKHSIMLDKRCATN